MDEQVELLIDNKLFSFWDDLEVNICIDKFDTVGFSAPFEPDNRQFRETFRPFSYKPVQVLIGGETIFTGTMLGVEPDCDSTSSRVTVTCYAQPGVLGDCSVPTGFGHKGRRSSTGAIPLEFKGMTLAAIAQQLCEPFGIGVQFRDPPGAPFEKVATKIDEKIHAFLTELAKQRGLVMTNDVDATLLFWRSIKRGFPVVAFEDGVPPFTGVKANFSPQDYFSEITGFAPAKHRKPGSRYTFLNPWLGALLDEAGGDPINTFRPMSCKFDDTERQDAPDATKAKVGRMFGNMVSYDTKDLPTWRDPQGKLWDVNTTCTLFSPRAMVYRETEMLIREVTFRQSKQKQSATLNLVLPGAFSGEIPETLPWND